MSNLYNPVLYMSFKLHCHVDIFLYILIIYLVIINNSDSILFYTNKRINEEINIYYKCKSNERMYLLCGRNKTKYKILSTQNKPHSSYLYFSASNYCRIIDKVECSNALILIGILTRPECIYERTLTRRWLKYIKNIKFVFITGISTNENINKLIKKEYILFKDLIFFNIVNSYYNCSLIMSCFYLYINNNCNNLNWVMKLDIDTYFNSKILLKIINNCSRNISVVGKINKSHKIKCNTKSKWSISCLNKSNKYVYIPSYPFGPAFLFKFSSITCINSYFMKIKYIIWIEDILFGIIMKYCNLKYLDITNYTEISYTQKYNLSITKNNILVHGLYPIEIYLANQIN